MRLFSLCAAILAVGLSVAVVDTAEAAKRLGGGKSVGMQRDMNTPKPANTNNATPAQTPGAPNAAAAPATAATGAAAAGSRSWLGPVAGIAAGLGLAALASHLGFGEELASFLLIALVVMVALGVLGFFMRKRAQQAMGGNRMAYAPAGAGLGQQPAVNRGYDVQMPAGGASVAAPTAARAWPAGFDAEGFARNAKVQFIRLQAAHDAGDLDDIRQFTTPEMFAEIRMDLAESKERGRNDVEQLDAEVLDVEEGLMTYTVSVRFEGRIRDLDTQAVDTFREIWHLSKPRNGEGGWVIAGIQQA